MSAVGLSQREEVGSVSLREPKSAIVFMVGSPCTHRRHAGTAGPVLHGPGVAIDVRLSVAQNDISGRRAWFFGYPILRPAVVVTLRLLELLWYRVVQRGDPIE